MEFSFGDKKFNAEVRKASDLKPVLAFPEALKEDFDAYFMFRDSYKTEKDRKRIEEVGLRYDYTVIPPNNIGGESIKTYGHYHPEAEDGYTYPEVYQVLEGEAIFLIQKPENDRIVDAVAIPAKKGDVVIIPPNYGHVTINPTEKELVTANWVCRDFKSIYDPYTEKRGACYYYIEGKWVKNENYGEVPELRFAKPVNIFGVEGNMYSLAKDIEKLEFLTKPGKHLDVFKKAFEPIS
ncbi:glucose-6-phosphate isomerase family protein [Archaeoglobus neptunius]|uniref:glucose-6-phosphate isomerase family protein n=1 Tax=Archaeoglobus neptunius TaxID=2798580 RepID=UPI0019293143|nr:glucose-6-phosphate isomerase family protein [Archaeoglobus neptunius]